MAPGLSNVLNRCCLYRPKNVFSSKSCQHFISKFPDQFFFRKNFSKNSSTIFSFGSVRAEILLRFKPGGSQLIDKITAAATRGVIHNLNVDPSSFKSFEIGMKLLIHGGGPYII